LPEKPTPISLYMILLHWPLIRQHVQTALANVSSF
jgi:hypothetical protein